MFHQQIDPKAVLARVAAERVLAAQAAAHRVKFDVRALGHARKRHVDLLLKDGTIVQGLLQLAGQDRLAVLEIGKPHVTWINVSAVADVDF